MVLNTEFSANGPKESDSDASLIGTVIDISSLGFTFKEQAALNSAGFFTASDILGEPEGELRKKITDAAVLNSVYRILAGCRIPLISSHFFSNKLTNILLPSNITDLEELLNTSWSDLNALPDINWSDMFEIIQKLDIMFYLP